MHPTFFVTLQFEGVICAQDDLFENKCDMKNMKWQDALQFGVMVLMGAAMPLSWHLGLWTAVLLAVVSLVKIFADHHARPTQASPHSTNSSNSPEIDLRSFRVNSSNSPLQSPNSSNSPVIDQRSLRVNSSNSPSPISAFPHSRISAFSNPALNGWMRAALWAAVAYVAIFAVSLLYSSNVDAGLNTLWHKAVLLIFPLCFLLTDTSWLKPVHVRIIFYALLVAVVGVFLYYTEGAIVKMVNGATLRSVTRATFDPRHHAYYALYALVALVFVYFELAEHWREMKVWHRVLLLVATLFGILYIVLVNSRAGIVGLYGMSLLCAMHLALKHKRWWQALLVAVLLISSTYAAESLLPGHQNRVLATLQAGKKDARVGITQSSINLIKDNPLTGQGVGDYEESLHDQYAEDEQTFKGKDFNAHNQYVETLLAVGVVGLLLLLAYLLLPLACAVGRKGVFWQVFFFTGVVLFNLFFESMLERQMGMLFIGFFLSLLVLVTSLENPHKIT